AALDAPWPHVRDPEYGMRRARLKARLREHPGRPLVLVVGSSRVCMGVKPDAWEAARPRAPNDPLLFNLGAVGAGPVAELIAVRRAVADGFRPAVVLLEYWPPVLRQDGRFGEPERVGSRLRCDDWPVVERYFPDPDRAGRQMLADRVNPLAGNRDKWVPRFLPELLPARRHADAAWRELDGWGWLPGMDVAPDDEVNRGKLTAHHRPHFRDRFDGWTLHPTSDGALREAVSLARSHGARVGLVFLPEGAGFRAWYPPEVACAGREHLARLVAELGVDAIDARDWAGDGQLADGLHLSRAGAGPFTARLGREVGRVFFGPTGGTP
ncbi:MAG: hypothetical protein K2V38_17440, partial [Gemmataceae bacterium]|nr:hypothetical protein [Gemmataceae bacterium]